MAAFGSMLEASSLISALKTLVTYSPEQTKISQLHQFDSLLSRNLEALAKALIKEPRYITLTKQLEEVGSPLVVLLKDEFDQVRCKKGEGDVGGNSIAHNFKYDIRWKFVKVCLDLLKLLKESISAAETRKKVIDQAQNAMRSGAPSLDQQVLSVSDQNTISTCFQFVASLGICPNLLPGVGVPLEIRSGFGNLFQISNDAMRNEKRLYYCIKTMVDCINQPVLGQLVLSRHLGDVLAGMLQILYAPTSSYEAVMTSSFNTILKWAKITKEKSTEQEESEKRKTASGESKNETLVMKPCSSEESCFRERATDPSKAINFQHSENIADEKSSDHKTNDYIKIFINEIEKEECSEILQRLLHTVYPPLIVRELLVLQGGMRQKPQTKTQGSVNKYDQDSVKNSSESEKRSQVKRASLFTTAPKWLWQVCGLLLSEMLMKANGLKAILKGILELSPSGKFVSFVIKNSQGKTDAINLCHLIINLCS